MVRSPEDDINTIKTIHEDVNETVPNVREQLQQAQDALDGAGKDDRAIEAGALYNSVVVNVDHDEGLAGQFGEYARSIEGAGGAFDELYGHADGEIDEVMTNLSEAMAALTEASNTLQTVQNKAEAVSNNATTDRTRALNELLSALETADDQLETVVEAVNELSQSIPDQQTLKDAFQSRQAEEYGRREYDF